MNQKYDGINSRNRSSFEGGTDKKFSSCDASRRCERCLGLYPLTEFRRRRSDRDRRFNHCRQCHNFAERTRRATAQGRATRRRVAEIIGRLRPDDPDRKAVVICEELIRHFGGLNGAVQAWFKCMNHDLERGGLAAMRHINLIFRLMAHCEPQPADYSRMSDEELRDAAISMGIDPDL
jgi:hypothetical protein